MGNMEQNTNTQQSGEHDKQSERTFTQEEVNKIVQDRLAREREKEKAAAGQSNFDEREKELERRELAMTAKELLYTKGLPKEFADVIYFTDRESLEKAIEVLERHYEARIIQEGFKPLPGAGLPKGLGFDTEPDNTRKAFGLD